MNLLKGDAFPSENAAGPVLALLLWDGGVVVFTLLSS